MPLIEVGGVGYEPVGDLLRGEEIIDPSGEEHLSLLLTAADLCNDARLQEEKGSWRVVGDTTEGALAVLAAKAGLSLEELERDQPRQGEVPFSPEHRRMTTLHGDRWCDHLMTYLKGAPDVVLPLCSRWQRGEEVIDLSEAWRSRILTANEELASGGLRVMAIAYRADQRERPEEELEQDLVFLGLTAIQAPPRGPGGGIPLSSGGHPPGDDHQ